MKAKVIAAAAASTLLFAAAVHAAPTVYTWTGMGINVPGSSKCASYKMTIDVTVDGSAVKGRFQQEGRPERTFETTRDAKGAIKTKAKLGGGSTIDVTGVISDMESHILLDGYCKFDATLTKK